MEAAYKEYLANYSNVTQLEDEYKQKEALWNDIVRVVKTSACVSHSFVFIFLCVCTCTLARTHTNSIDNNRNITISLNKNNQTEKRK